MKLLWAVFRIALMVAAVCGLLAIASPDNRSELLNGVVIAVAILVLIGIRWALAKASGGPYFFGLWRIK